MEVERVITNAPSDCALLTGGGRLIRLALVAQIHYVVPANSAIVHDDVPSPQSDGVPLFHLESLLLPLRTRGRLLDIFIVYLHSV